jgi:hypothetical protein
MDPLKRLPGSRRYPPGREWTLLKKLPTLFVLGTALLVAVGLVAWWATPSPPTAAEERSLLLLHYQLAGAVFLHWSLLLVVAIGCVIVRVMKGPMFVADQYPPADREPMER